MGVASPMSSAPALSTALWGGGFTWDPASNPVKVGIYPQFTEQETEFPRLIALPEVGGGGSVGETWARPSDS